MFSRRKGVSLRVAVEGKWMSELVLESAVAIGTHNRRRLRLFRRR